MPMGLKKMTQTYRNLDMDMASNIGQMVLIMKVNGFLTKLKVKVLSGMQRVMYTEENSKTIWQMAMASTPTSMARSIKENSRMMSKKVMEKKSGFLAGISHGTWMRYICRC